MYMPGRIPAVSQRRVHVHVNVQYEYMYEQHEHAGDHGQASGAAAKIHAGLTHHEGSHTGADAPPTLWVNLAATGGGFDHRMSDRICGDLAHLVEIARVARSASPLAVWPIDSRPLLRQRREHVLARVQDPAVGDIKLCRELRSKIPAAVDGPASNRVSNESGQL